MTKLASSIIFVVTALVATSCSAFGSTELGSGNAKTEQRTVESFTKVRVGTAIAATVIVGPDISVSVTADDNLLANVRTSVNGGRLTVEMQGSNTPRTPVTVAITVPTLDDVEAWSAGSVTATGINATSLTASADSAGSVVARGNSTSVDVSASSAGRADLGDVAAQTATVKIGSAGSATVNAQQSVSGSVDTGGLVRIQGNPPTVNVTTATGGAVVRD